MKTLVVIALPAEVGGKNLSTSHVDVLFTGIGKLNAYQKTREALRTKSYDHVVNVGTVGSAKYTIGTILRPTVIRQGDFFLAENTLSEIVVGKGERKHVLLTQDNFISFDKNIDGSLNIPDELKAVDCFDMEGYAIARAAEFMKENVSFIKIVSDNLDGTVFDWEKSLERLAPKLRSALVSFINNELHTSYEPAEIR